MPPRSDKADNVEKFEEIFNPEHSVSSEYYHGDVPEAYPAYDVDPTSEKAHKAEKKDSETSPKPHAGETQGVTEGENEEAAKDVSDDEYESLTRDQMLADLNEAGIEHDLRANAARAKVLLVYKAHFESPRG